MTPCDTVAERIALGEPLDELAEHAAGCARCRGLVALPAELATLHRDADPGLGFTSRMTAGAQQRLAARRRRRIAAGMCGMVAAAALAVLVVTRTPAAGPGAQPAPAQPMPAALDTTSHHAKPDPWKDPAPAVDPDVRSLLHLAHAARVRHHARWSHLEAPLAPYRALLQGVTP